MRVQNVRKDLAAAAAEHSPAKRAHSSSSGSDVEPERGWLVGRGWPGLNLMLIIVIIIIISIIIIIIIISITVTVIVIVTTTITTTTTTIISSSST